MAEEVDESEVFQSISLSPIVQTKFDFCRKKQERFCCGYLVGDTINEKLHVYDLIDLDLSLFENVNVEESLTENIVAEFSAIRSSFPVGLSFVGVFITQPEQENIEVAEHLRTILKQLEDIAFDQSLVTCLIKPSECIWSLFLEEENQTIPITDIVVEKQRPELVLFRVRHDGTLNWLTKTGIEGLCNALETIERDFICHKPAFLIEEIGTILYDDDEGRTLPNSSCKNLIGEIKSSLGVKELPADNVVEVQTLTRMTHSKTTEDEQCSVPVLHSYAINGESMQINVNFDVLVAAHFDSTTTNLVYLFCDAIYRQHKAMRMLMEIRNLSHLFSVFHFKPEHHEYPITVLMPDVDFKGESVDEKVLLAFKKRMHDRFLLPNDAPVFHPELTFFDHRVNTVSQLVNPHNSLKTPDIDGKLATVSGNYTYHHYMQDNFDDNIWGCAYRSLQTLASWFWLQGYTDKTYPSHREIQQALVDCGDKDASIIGSKEWIGSQEVSYVLNQIYGVTCKTIHVSSGADLAYKGRDLYNHFVEHGTPIMIGGGVLAHSIVGVLYNELTGDIRYLIVDPHYTGSDNLKTIHAKSWVGWKGSDFWDKNSHYNLCLPLRPRI